MPSKYDTFAPTAASSARKYPTPGRRPIVTPIMGLHGVAILDGRDHVALLAPDRVSARRYLREEERL